VFASYREFWKGCINYWCICCGELRAHVASHEWDDAMRCDRSWLEQSESLGLRAEGSYVLFDVACGQNIIAVLSGHALCPQSA